MLHRAIRELMATSAAALLVVMVPLAGAMAAPGVVGNAASKAGAALGSGVGSAANAASLCDVWRAPPPTGTE